MERRFTESSSDNDSVSGLFWHSRSPVVLVDAEGLVERVNHSFRLLMSPSFGRCQGRSFHETCACLSQTLDANLLALGQACVSSRGGHDRILNLTQPVFTAPLRLDSPEFGRVELQARMIPQIHRSCGVITGLIVEFAILKLADEAAFDRRLNDLLTHEILWEVYAASYDRVLNELPFYRQMVERHIEAMSQSHIARVLDIGAGTGNVAVELLRRGKQVTAIEPTWAMLSRLLEKTSTIAPDQLRTIGESAEDLSEIPDGHFDGVTISLAFFDMSQPWVAFSETIRVLKPGGLLVVTEPKQAFQVRDLQDEAERVLKSKGLFSELHEDWCRLQQVAAAMARIVRGGWENPQGVRSDPWCIEAAIEALQSADFQEIHVRDSHLGNCATVSARRSEPGNRQTAR